MRMIPFLTAAAIMLATSIPVLAAEGTLDAPVVLQLPPDGQVVERKAEIKKMEIVSAYGFSLSEWSDLSIAFPEISGKVTLTLLRDNEGVLNRSDYDQPKDPFRLTSGPGNYLLLLKRERPQQDLAYTLQLSAATTSPRSAERAGDRAEQAKDIGIFEPGTRHLTERTDAGGGRFFYRFNLPELSHIDMTIKADNAPVRLKVKGEGIVAYTRADAKEPNRLEVVLKKGLYTLEVGVLTGNTDFRVDMRTEPADALPPHLVAGSDMASARPIGRIGEKPLTLEGALRRADNDANWYRFSLDAPSTLNVNTTPSSDRNIVIQVIDPVKGLPDGLAMPRWHKDDGRISFNLAKGVHLLRVITYDSGASYGLNLWATSKE